MRLKQRIALRDYLARRIALLKPSALGDIVHALPVLSAMRHRYPDAEITWIVNRSYEPLLGGHPHLNSTLAFDRGLLKNGLGRTAATLWGFLSKLRRQRFDLVIDLQGLLRTGLMAWASGAARKVGLSTAREGAHWFYTDTLPVAGHHSVHAVDRYWSVAEALGAGHWPKQFLLPIGNCERRWALERLRSHPRPWLGVSLGTRWDTKRWPVEHFVELSRRATKAAGGTVILVGSGDEGRLASRFVAIMPSSVCNLVGQTTLPQLAAVLNVVDVMLANDSGPLHLAAALGKPVIAPYTCTSPASTGPYGQMEHAVVTQVACAASYLKKCNRMDCMKELTPDRLWPVLERVLHQCQRRIA
jgi:lipopolysaccharide heptosyltransferase I